VNKDLLRLFTLNNYLIPFLTIVYFIIGANISTLSNIKKCPFFIGSYCVDDVNKSGFFSSWTSELFSTNKNIYWAILLLIVTTILIIIKFLNKYFLSTNKLNKISSTTFNFYLSLVVAYAALNPQLLRLVIITKNINLFFVIILSLILIFQLLKRNNFNPCLYILITFLVSGTSIFISMFIIYFTTLAIYLRKIKFSKQDFFFFMIGIFSLLFKTLLYVEEHSIINSIILSNISYPQIFNFYFGNLSIELMYGIFQFTLTFLILSLLVNRRRTQDLVLKIIPPIFVCVVLLPNSTLIIFAYATLLLMTLMLIDHEIFHTKNNVSLNKSLLSYLIFCFQLSTFKPIWSIANEVTFFQLFSISRSTYLIEFLYLKNALTANLFVWSIVFLSIFVGCFKYFYELIRSCTKFRH
jgi:hypothetical protein